MDEVLKTIDIENLIRSSKSRFLRSLPDFVVRFIIKSVHQEEMNQTIHNNRDKNGVPFIDGVLKDWNVNVEVRHEENIPASGRYVFVANHPLGGMDSLAFLSAIYRHFPDVVSPSNELFNYIPQLKPVILGVNVFGKNSKETAEKLNLLFASDCQIMIFPAGEVSRRKKRIISDPDWQKTFITKAIQYKRDIIPVYIYGRNSNLFYFVANLRKILGIRLYVETALLPAEMMRQRNRPINLCIGKVISYQTISTGLTHFEWAQKIKETVYSLNS